MSVLVEAWRGNAVAMEALQNLAARVAPALDTIPRWASVADLATDLSDGRWVRAAHLDLLDQKVQDVLSGKHPRLLVTMPPRHGKSQFISHWLPVWLLNEHPEWPVILTSYEADFAASWGRQVRNTIREQAGRLRVSLSADSTAINHWNTTRGGGMVTAGVGGPITGRGARLLICDDPVKNADEAYSPAYRERTWDWWLSTAYTRLEPGAGAILVMTRWHMDDLAGRLLAEEEHGGEHWEVVNLPAVAESGDALGRPLGAALWPERYSRDDLDRIKRALGTFVWSSLYQQSPLDKEGGMFRREWFDVVEAAPADGQTVRYWDFAATEPKRGTDPDWTVGAKVTCKNGQFWLIDLRRARLTPQGVESLVAQTAAIDGRGVAIGIEEEGGSSGKNTIDHYRRHVLVGYTMRGYRVSGSKSERARPVSAAAEAGNIKLVKGLWVGDALAELEAFPGGTHDDIVDSLSGGFEMLTMKRSWGAH